MHNSRSLTRYRSERERDPSRADASRGASERSHLVPCVRLRSAVSCHTSGTIVEIGIDMLSDKPNILQTGRTAVRHMGGADDHPSRLTDTEL